MSTCCGDHLRCVFYATFMPRASSLSDSTKRQKAPTESMCLRLRFKYSHKYGYPAGRLRLLHATECRYLFFTLSKKKRGLEENRIVLILRLCLLCSILLLAKVSGSLHLLSQDLT